MATQRFHTLDAMRGVAALAVVSLHLMEQFDYKPDTHAYLAVDFFFMLSGFVLATAYQGRIGNGLSPLEFVTARFVRLYPMYFVGFVLGVITLLGQNAAHSGHSMSYAESIVSISTAAFVVPDPLANTYLFPMNPPAWSLFFELLANIVLAVAIVRISTNWLITATLTFALAYAAGTIDQGQMSAGVNWGSLPLGMVRVSFGFGVGVLFARQKILQQTKTYAALCLFPVLLVTMFVPAQHGQSAIFDLCTAFIALPGIVWLGARWQMPTALTGVCAALGDMSYPLYAIHFPLMRMSSFAAKSFGMSALVFSATFLLGATILSWQLSRYLDLPARRWLTRQLRSVRSIAVPAP